MISVSKAFETPEVGKKKLSARPASHMMNDDVPREPQDSKVVSEQTSKPKRRKHNADTSQSILVEESTPAFVNEPENSQPPQMCTPEISNSRPNPVETIIYQTPTNLVSNGDLNINLANSEPQSRP